MATDAFSADVESYPSAAAVPASVISAQRRAALWWFHGADAAGRRTSEISVPTLVADGTEDQLDAVSNSRTIARLIPEAKLLIYPDAGHGFLFQEGTPFAVTVESFLSGPARPASTATIRAEFVAGEAAVTAAGKTWVSQLKGLSTQSASSGVGGVLSSSPTAAQVDRIDQPFASAFAALDYRLLSAGATGHGGGCDHDVRNRRREARRGRPRAGRAERSDRQDLGGDDQDGLRRRADGQGRAAEGARASPGDVIVK